MWSETVPVGQMGPRMRQIVGFDDQLTGGGNLGGGENVVCPIVTSGELGVYLCESA